MVGHSEASPKTVLIEAVDGKVCLTFDGNVAMVLNLSSVQVTQDVCDLPRVSAEFYGTKG